MRVHIEAGEWAKRWLGGTEAVVEAEAPVTAGEAVHRAGLPEDEIGVLSLDGTRILPAYILRDGDTVKVYPHIIGG